MDSCLVGVNSGEDKCVGTMMRIGWVLKCLVVRSKWAFTEACINIVEQFEI